LTQDLLDKMERLFAAADQDALLAVLDELQPYDIASILPEMSEPRQLSLLGLLPPGAAAEALEHLDYDRQYHLLDHLEERHAGPILREMSSDGVVDLLKAIHPRQARELLRLLPPDDRTQVQQMMQYPENSAGGRMAADYLAVRQDRTADQVIAHFRKVGRQVELANYVYVVDREGRLVGVTSMRDVLLAAPATLVGEIMYTKIVSVPARADQEAAARLLSQYDFVALPVVDSAGRMVGVITVDDVLDVIEEEATEDIHRLGGSQPLDQPYLQASMREMFTKRIGWLLVLFIAQSITSNILRHHEAVLEQVVALTFFIPLLIGTGGNTGSQASTLVIRAMSLGEVTLKDFAAVIWKEARLGLALGLTMAAAAYLRAKLLGGDMLLGTTVAVTVAVLVLVSAMVGAALPLVGRRLGFDPAVFSSPLVTTVVDATGLIIYMQTARMILAI
jgi:magnesium transporter